MVFCGFLWFSFRSRQRYIFKTSTPPQQETAYLEVKNDQNQTQLSSSTEVMTDIRSRTDADQHLKNIRASNGLDKNFNVPQAIVKNLEAAANV
jgi:hypothetical protein